MIFTKARASKNPVDPYHAYAAMVEDELSAAGFVEPVATLFLTNRECPFHCVYCDLWKNTTDDSVPVGAIPAQIDDALGRLPSASHIKLYNSGNFFDQRAIAVEDWSAIAQRLHTFRTVIVENHPRLCNDDCLKFRDLLPDSCEFEIAMGLETCNPDVLPRLEKQMTLDDFQRACQFLRTHGIHIRVFILLQPPWQIDTEEAIAWAVRSAEWAFDQGARCCVVIPTRSGNGIVEQLMARGEYQTPRLRSLESVHAQLIAAARRRIFVDTWDLQRFSRCSFCLDARSDRLRQMNLLQELLPAVRCTCEDPQ